MSLKRDFILVFNPYVKPGECRPYRYKVISANRLESYMSEKWAAYLRDKLADQMTDKEVYKLRHCGTIYAYRR